ncbi:MAG TPA: pyridoxamine 5'-phosphate oxidase family protein [Anaerolineales bacterium]|nr:pyridoxamine 5'-phosphate oxidase family protein [Anaerolineales bacterium]
MIDIPDTHRDLLNTDIGILATVTKNGYPQVTALWFLYDEDGLVKLYLNNTRQKTKNLRNRQECTFFIIDRANPLRTLEIRARAELQPDPNYSFAPTFDKKYGSDTRKMDPPGQSRIVATLHPVRINAIDLSRR